jgi:hypothetical protein
MTGKQSAGRGQQLNVVPWRAHPLLLEGRGQGKLVGSLHASCSEELLLTVVWSFSKQTHFAGIAETETVLIPLREERGLVHS